MRSYVSKSVTTVFARRQSLWLFDFKHKSISSLPLRDFSGWSRQAWWWRPFGRHILACVVSRWRTHRHMHRQGMEHRSAVHGRVGGRGVHVAAPSGTKATVQRSGKEQAKLDHQASLRHDQKRDGCGPTISCKVSWRNIASWGQALLFCRDSLPLGFIPATLRWCCCLPSFGRVLATRLFQVSRIPAELQIPSLAPNLAPNLAPSGLHFLGRSRQGCQLMGWLGAFQSGVEWSVAAQGRQGHNGWKMHRTFLFEPLNPLTANIKTAGRPRLFGVRFMVTFMSSKPKSKHTRILLQMQWKAKFKKRRYDYIIWTKFLNPVYSVFLSAGD